MDMIFGRKNKSPNPQTSPAPTTLATENNNSKPSTIKEEEDLSEKKIKVKKVVKAASKKGSG